MKKLLTLLLLCGIVPIGASAQYQLSNSGFEDWEDVSGISYNNKDGEEPEYWKYYLTGSGGSLYLTFAAYNQIEKSSDAHSGDACAMIYARDVLLSNVAQGNLTTGCINMGSMSASDGTGNYNYTNLDVEGQNMAFTGLPDEMHVWLKVQVTNYTAKATALLHTDGYYQDPYANEDKITATLVATAADTEIASTDGEWVEYTIPFVYENGAETRPAYALVSFATSSTPGAGTGYSSSAGTGDVMWIDDVTMVYFSELASLSYDGVSIFEEGAVAYDMSETEYDAAKLEAASNGIGATIETSYDEGSALLTITVKGDNISEDAENYHTYTIQFKAAQKEVTEYDGYLNISLMGSAITENSPATVEITDNGDGTCDFLLPDLSLEDLGSLGDIELKGVTVTEENGTYTYSGYEADMQLLDGEIVADVTLTGTITSDGTVNMVISVVWKVDDSTTLPVEVTFTTNQQGGISNILVSPDEGGLVDVYTISGVKVLSGVTVEEASDRLPSGIYVMGNKKILVK